GEHHAGEQNREDGRAAAEAREPPDERDRDERAGKRGERHERGRETEDDRGHRSEGRTGGRAGDEWIGERIAQETLEERAGGRERSSNKPRAEHARKAQLTDDRAVHVVRPKERGEHVAGSARDGAAEETPCSARD